MNSCIIVAGGPSAKGFVPPPGVPIIAVNGAIKWLARADYFFTLDPSPLNITRMRVKRRGVQYFAAVPEDIELPSWVTRYNRVARRGEEPADKTGVDWVLWRYSCVKALCTEPGSIHTGNSAWGALGLAYHLGFKHVALVGVDATTDNTVCGHRTGDLRHLAALFNSALDQIDVVSCGKLDSIPQMTLSEWLCKFSPS